MNPLFPISIAVVGIGIVVGLTMYLRTTPEEIHQEESPTNFPGSVLSLETTTPLPLELQDVSETNDEITSISPEVNTAPKSFTQPTQEPGPTAQKESSSSPSISFIDTPNIVRSGERFTIGIRINGESGTQGSNANLTINQQASSQEAGSSSSVSNSSKQSFGSFTVPATFESTYSFASTPNAPLKVTATAEVGGETITATRTITIQ